MIIISVDFSKNGVTSDEDKKNIYNRILSLGWKWAATNNMANYAVENLEIVSGCTFYWDLETAAVYPDDLEYTKESE